MLCPIIANAFVAAYLQSDQFGRGIFLGLFLLSGISWTVLCYKVWLLTKVKKHSLQFSSSFDESVDLLHLQFPSQRQALHTLHPFFEIYKSLKKSTLQVFQRNRALNPQDQTSLSQADLDLIASNTQTTIATQAQNLEKNLFLLSTIVTLGPFLGLLGTVWGILLALSELQHAHANSSILSELSMALATTVIGLLVAIPAIIGNNYLRNQMQEYRRSMHYFSDLLLTNIELKYRR